MVETLYIRLGSQVQDPISWLIYSSREREIIASGELPNASALSELTERAKERQVTVFVNASDISFHSLKVPAKSQRAMRQAAPFMVEELLAQDVEELFFAYGQLPDDETGHNCYLAGVAKAQLMAWQTWLQEAKIKTDTMIPDALALPYTHEKWSLISLGDQVLVRQGLWQAMCLDENTFNHAMSQWQNDENITLANYSPFEFTQRTLACAVEPQEEELPLALLAQHADAAPVNLLQGEFQVKLKKSNNKQHWLIAASIAGFALFAHLAYTGLTLYKVNQEQQAIEQTIVATYKKAFPDAKRVKVTTVRSQMNRKLAELGAGGQDASFLNLLNKVQPAFASVPQIKPESVKYDGKRNEIRLTAVAQNYQAFDQFKAALEKLQLEVNIGSQNNQGQQVVGSMSIKG